MLLPKSWNFPSFSGSYLTQKVNPYHMTKLSNPLLIIIIIELFYLHESNCKELLCTSEEVADYMDY